MLLGTLGASLLGNLLKGKGIVRDDSGNKKWKGIVRAGTGRPMYSASQKQWDFQYRLIRYQTLKYKNIMKTNQDLMVFFQEMIYLKIKVGAYVINLDEYSEVGTHWMALFCSRNEIVYFDSFAIEICSWTCSWRN